MLTINPDPVKSGGSDHLDSQAGTEIGTDAQHQLTG
jgi:hypothetical protein